MTEKSSVNMWALWSLIFAVVGIFVPLASLIAIILAGRYFYYNKKTDVVLKGKGLAVAGMSIGVLMLAWRVILVISKTQA